MKAVNHCQLRLQQKKKLFCSNPPREYTNFFSPVIREHSGCFIFDFFPIHLQIPRYNKTQHFKLETEFNHFKNRFNLLPSWCPVWPQLVLTKGAVGAAAAERGGRCEKQVFGSLQHVYPSDWTRGREDKHNLINTNTHTRGHKPRVNLCRRNKSYLCLRVPPVPNTAGSPALGRGLRAAKSVHEGLRRRLLQAHYHLA